MNNGNKAFFSALALLGGLIAMAVTIASVAMAHQAAVSKIDTNSTQIQKLENRLDAFSSSITDMRIIQAAMAERMGVDTDAALKRAKGRKP